MLNKQVGAVEAVERALAAIRESNAPLDATVAAVDAMLALDGVFFDDERLGRLFDMLPTAREILHGARPHLSGLVDLGVDAMKALIASWGIPCEGAYFSAQLNLEERARAACYDSYDGNIAQDVLAKHSKDLEKMDALLAPLIEKSRADLCMLKAGLAFELSIGYAAQAGRVYDRARAPYVVASTRAEVARRDRARTDTAWAADEAKLTHYYNELGAIAVSETFQ